MYYCALKVIIFLFLAVILSVAGEETTREENHRNLRGRERKNRKEKVEDIWTQHLYKWNRFKSYLDSDRKPFPYGNGNFRKGGYTRDEYLDTNQLKAMKYRQGRDVDEAMSTIDNP